MIRFRSLAWVDLVVLLILLLLVWGFDPIGRGIRFFSDDGNFLSQAWRHRADPWTLQISQRYFADGVTRSFAFWPFVGAVHLSHPGAFLQCVLGFAWLLCGMSAVALTRVIAPTHPEVQFLSGCLTLTATSDYHTSAVVYAPHIFGIALFFFAAAGLLAYISRGSGVVRLSASVVALSISFFTVEYTYPCVPLVALMALFVAGSWRSRPFQHAIMGLLISFIPPAICVIKGMLSSSSYSGRVLAATSDFSSQAFLAFRHFAHNFLPVNWYLRVIPPWRQDYEPVIPLSIVAILSGFGAIIVICRYFFLARSRPTSLSTPKKVLPIVVSMLFAALLINIVSSRLGGEYFIRSHFVSRIWVSISLALLSVIVAQWRLGNLYIAAATLFFIAFGVAGGLERQANLLNYSNAERIELSSLTEAIPHLAPTANLLVVVPPGAPSGIAANSPNTYTLLYKETGIENRIILSVNSEYKSSSIRASSPGVLISETSGEQPAMIDISKCVVVFYSVSQSKFVRLDELPAGFLKGAGGNDSYQPHRWISGKKTDLSPLAREVISYRSALTRAPTRKAPTRPTNISISQSLQVSTSADPLVPSLLERVDDNYVVWLGSGRAEGYGVLIWSAVDQSVTLRTAISPGPNMNGHPGRLHLAYKQAGGNWTNTIETLSNNPIPGIHVALRAGMNFIDIWVEVDGSTATAQQGDPRNLCAYLQHIFIEP